MRILYAITFTAVSLATAAPVPEIRVDQAGYVPNAPKLAAVVSATTAKTFTVNDAATGKPVFASQAAAAVQDPDSGDAVQALDFTKLSMRGRFYIDVPGIGRSWEFAVGPDVYRRPFYLAMRSFYGQRCGTAVDLGKEFPGYRYAACHLEGGMHSSSGKSGTHVSKKGWHDAGDYGRYIVNSGITTGTLLWMYELFGSKLKNTKLDIPESGNGTPDILNEIRWNLEWMLTMQDGDGGVWHKQTSERFAGFVMPEKDTSVSYVIGTGSEPYKNSCATADFAAVLAIAGRLYKPFDASFANTALAAAQQAWSWVEKHPNVLFRNPQGVVTGAYGDNNCGDEILWAAAELWRTTSNDDYHKYFLANYSTFLSNVRPAGPPSWPNVGALGLWSYALGRRGDAAAITKIKNESVRAADEIAKRSAAHPYRISMTTRDYVWGSNGVAANYGVQLLIANVLAPNPRYVETAVDNLHYLLGRNAFSLSWVTQVGANPYRHPHHRPSGADTNSEPWPGMLSGGPNGRKQDPAMQKMPDYIPPARMYVDDQASYASNEMAINWNAPLVFLLAGVM
jgi:endoglucanase